MSFLKNLGEKLIDTKDPIHQSVKQLSIDELKKTPSRTEVINFLLGKIEGKTTYLEIGVRNPDDNFNHINATSKYSVDPGVEFESNPVDFKMTSDEFFTALRNGEVLKDVKFDIIFVDGLHLADQVDRDIQNSLEFINTDGYVLLHDCNPLSVWHAREFYNYKLSPAGGHWNGTTWKAFAKARQRSDLSSCCLDTDWGIGIITQSKTLGKPNQVENPYYEYFVLEENRKETLNLMSFEEFKLLLKQ
ncbi:class I SAM-dependent methyltransferase [Ekhidna sp.]|uniref:class I SAM-dependent methyltransferase n=1 Tax=Ekhidna sp. TaxID=2608089 RepID=UPI00329A37AF